MKELVENRIADDWKIWDTYKKEKKNVRKENILKSLLSVWDIIINNKNL